MSKQIKEGSKITVELVFRASIGAASLITVNKPGEKRGWSDVISTEMAQELFLGGKKVVAKKKAAKKKSTKKK